MAEEPKTDATTDAVEWHLEHVAAGVMRTFRDLITGEIDAQDAADLLAHERFILKKLWPSAKQIKDTGAVLRVAGKVTVALGVLDEIEPLARAHLANPRSSKIGLAMWLKAHPEASASTAALNAAVNADLASIVERLVIHGEGTPQDVADVMLIPLRVAIMFHADGKLSAEDLRGFANATSEGCIVHSSIPEECAAPIRAEIDATVRAALTIANAATGQGAEA